MTPSMDEFRLSEGSLQVGHDARRRIARSLRPQRACRSTRSIASAVAGGIWAMFAVVLLPGEWGGAVPAAVSAQGTESSATPTPHRSPPVAPQKGFESAAGPVPTAQTGEGKRPTAESSPALPGPAVAETEHLVADPRGVGSNEAFAVPVPLGASVMLRVPGRLERASVMNADIASIQVVPPNQIRVNGKVPGITSVIAWASNERRYFDVVVLAPATRSESAPGKARTAQTAKGKRPAAGSTPTPPGATVAEREQVAAAPRGIGTNGAIAVPITIGSSVILRVPGRLERASVTNADIANIQVVPPDQILVNGKAPGITTVIAWANDERRYFDIVVKANLELLQSAMRQLSPRDEIRVEAAQTSVVLSGTVSDAALVVKAAEVARAFLPEKAGVINLLRLAEPHQIMLKVDVAEVNRSGLRELGVDFLHLGTSLAVAFFGGTTAGILSTTFDKDGTSFFDNRTSAVVRQGDNRVFLRALEQKGLVKFLARPTLTAASGASASFLAGGEFPVPVVTGGGVAGTTAVTIVYKPFGVRLEFTPTLNDFESINLKITPEVSDLDFDNAVTLNGFRIPALRTRRTSTVVDLKPGQGLAVGGLISSQDRKTLSKVPILGDIPVLGALFRSTQFVRNETDLVVFVTPEIVKPLTEVPNLDQQMRTTPDEDKELRQIPGK